MSKLGEIKHSDGSFYAWAWYCPGCKTSHLVTTSPPHPGGPVWQFNGDTEKPTFTPSIRVGGGPKDAPTNCHTYITDGKINFLPDCTHEFAGKTVELEDWDESKL